MFASIRIKEMLARVSPSFDSNFASRLRRLVGVFTHRRFVSFSLPNRNARLFRLKNWKKKSHRASPSSPRPSSPWTPPRLWRCPQSRSRTREPKTLVVSSSSTRCAFRPSRDTEPRWCTNVSASFFPSSYSQKNSSGRRSEGDDISNKKIDFWYDFLPGKKKRVKSSLPKKGIFLYDDEFVFFSLF